MNAQGFKQALETINEPVSILMKALKNEIGPAVIMTMGTFDTFCELAKSNSYDIITDYMDSDERFKNLIEYHEQRMNPPDSGSITFTTSPKNDLKHRIIYRVIHDLKLESEDIEIYNAIIKKG